MSITQADSPTIAPEDSEPITKTDYTTTTDETGHSTEHVSGHNVTVDSTETSTVHTTGEFDDRVKRLISEADARRQAKEDERSIKRNRNRLYTLLAAVLIGLAVVWSLPHFGHVGAVLSPYSFVITVLFDTTLTLWAYIHRY
jgi:hypothetical protein